MEHDLIARIVPQILAAIPAGETLVGLSIQDRGRIMSPWMKWPAAWAPGMLEIEIQTYAMVDGAQGVKTWTAFRGTDGYMLRLDGFRSEMPPPVLGLGNGG